MAKDRQEIVDELVDMFNEVRPDQEYLDDDEDAAESVRDIRSLLSDPTTKIQEKIEALVAFNEEWFPDGLSDDDQESYRSLLDEAKAISA